MKTVKVGKWLETYDILGRGYKLSVKEFMKSP